MCEASKPGQEIGAMRDNDIYVCTANKPRQGTCAKHDTGVFVLM